MDGTGREVVGKSVKTAVPSDDVEGPLPGAGGKEEPCCLNRI